MKTKNFPERKNDRRKLAYYNLKARINQLELEGKEVKTELRNELDSLEKKIIQNNDGEFVVKVKIPEFDPFNLYSWELGVTEEELLISDFRELVKNYLKGDNELGAVSVLTKWIVGNIELSINQ